MMQIIPNSGIMGNDALDKLRGNAILAVHKKGLPEDVVYYLRALEDAYLNSLHQQKKRALAEIKWPFDTDSTP